MTIDPLFFNETSSIAYPEHFYPVEIEVSHHQLRNFISTVYHDKIFYVNKHDVYILDLETLESSLLVTIEFDARCLAAAHGWVCVGGETRGDCAFIHIGEYDGQPGTFCHDLDIKMLGKEIVNAMNIQVLKSDPEDIHARDEIVVLVGNNDYTVTVYSLCQRIVLTTISHPQPMNYAALSPDSTIMAAVGDENKVYFLRRSLVPNTSDEMPDTSYFPEYEWLPLADPKIPRGSLQKDDFSFAIAFSPDGRLCAVSSQGGAISVFDMDAIAAQEQPAEDAMICTFRSSREDSLWGCVRSMAFSPEHWDVLAWTEDHGRVGLADVRQGFQRRQHIPLDESKATAVEIHDSTPPEWKSLNHKERMQRQRQQRQQALRGHPPVGARFMSDDREAQSETMRLTTQEADDLSQRERAMDEALDAALGESIRPPYSITYFPSRDSQLRRDYEVQLLNPSSRFTPSHIPRRRPSVVLSASLSSQRLVVDESSRMTMTASPGPISDDGIPPPMSTNDLTPASGTNSSQPLPYNIPPSDPWHVIEASLASQRTEHTSSARQPASLQRIENAISNERQLENYMTRQLSDEQRLLTMLRSAIDARDRSQQIRQELRSDQSHADRLSPHIERALALELSHDVSQCQIRLEQLTDMIRNMPRRLDQLRDERETLRYRSRNAITYDRVFPASARSTALPTTALARVDLTEMEQRLQRIEDEREFLVHQIEQMERDVRRAENHIELASFSNESVPAQPRDRVRTSANDRTDSSTYMNRLLAGNEVSSATTESPYRAIIDSARAPVSSEEYRQSHIARRMRQRTAQGSTDGVISRTVVARVSDHITRYTPTDLYTARVMASRTGADGNGNWRRFGQSQAPTNTTAIEEILREGGVGTAGLGWSPDGLKL